MPGPTHLQTDFDRLIRPRLLEVQCPARYLGAEPGSITKDWQQTPLRFAYAFPDLYEIGMSYHGREVIYQQINARPDCLCERTFIPAADMCAVMREEQVPLWTLESRRAVADFDVLGFSLTHELAYPSALYLLELARIPIRAHDRNNSHPVVIAGGQCMCNPEPVAPFFDIIVNGEAEAVLNELLDLLIAARDESKQDLLELAARLPGCYVPWLYEPRAVSHGRQVQVEPRVDGLPPRIERRYVVDLTSRPLPVDPVQPYIDVPSDKAYLEVMRGCPQGCRFCQAGYITRPARARSVEQLAAAAAALERNTGADEISLMSLSTLDHPQVLELIQRLKSRLPPGVGVAVPSLRADAMSAQLAELLRRPRETSLTIALEAGGDRLRCAINKRVTAADIRATFTHLLTAGWHKFKLYFMCGFAGEELAAMDETAAVIDGIFALARQLGAKKPQFNVSMSVLVPKAHTPLAWQAMERPEETRHKQQRLRELLKKHRGAVKLNWHDSDEAVIEALISRGGRELADLIESACGAGQVLLSDRFDYAVWEQLLANHEIDLDQHVFAGRDPRAPQPWDHIDRGVSRQFLEQQWQAYQLGIASPPCHEQCTACGLGCTGPVFADQVVE